MTEATKEGTLDAMLTIAAGSVGGIATTAQVDVRVIAAFDTTELSYEMWPDRPSRSEFVGTRSAVVETRGAVAR